MLLGPLLPLLFLLGLAILVFPHAQPKESNPDLALGAFLQAAVFTGTFATVLAETLSAAGLLTAGGVGVAWVLGVGAVVVVAGRTRWREPIRLVATSLRKWFRGAAPVERAVLLAFLGLMASVLLIALVSPPNTTDVQLYHGPRVLHWIQNQSMGPFATAYLHQVYQPIWSEMAVLQLRLLYGGEGLSNTVQWFAYAAAILAVAGTSRLLGAASWGGWLGAAFVASVPVVILQASSSKNDLVAGAWLSCVVYFAFLSRMRHLTRGEALCLGLASGLGVLTKGTFLFFSIPILAWALVPFLTLRSSAGKGPIALGLAGGLALNFPHWARNAEVFGSPVGPPQVTSELLGSSVDPVVIALRVTSNLAQNFVVPGGSIRLAVESLVIRLYELLGRDLAGFRLPELWNHEDQAGNPIHLLLAAAVLGLLVVGVGRSPRPARGYAFLCLASYVLFSAGVRYDLTGVRYQIPWFVMCAPLVGAELSHRLPAEVRRTVVSLFLIASLPWVLLNRTRPLVGWPPRTAVSSVLIASKGELLFANWRERQAPTENAAAALRRTACTSVGLRIDSHDWEYPFWAEMGAPESGVRLEVLNPVDELRPYLDSAFSPCAILCTICGGRERLHGLARSGEWGDVILYTGGGYHPDPDG
ncbi:MAG: hypothetical protein WD906_07740 [Anaerolineales bacterium]